MDYFVNGCYYPKFQDALILARESGLFVVSFLRHDDWAVRIW